MSDYAAVAHKKHVSVVNNSKRQIRILRDEFRAQKAMWQRVVAEYDNIGSSVEGHCKLTDFAKSAIMHIEKALKDATRNARRHK